jgi:hypothetical protein
MKHVLQNKKYKNRELEILQQIAHENIVRLHGSFFMEEKEGTFLNLVMEYIPETLSKAVKINYASKTFLPTNMVKTYAKSLLQALQYLHVYPSSCRKITFVIAISSLPISSSTMLLPNCATLAQQRYWLRDRRTLRIFARGTTALLSYYLEPFSIRSKWISGRWAA